MHTSTAAHLGIFFGHFYLKGEGERGGDREEKKEKKEKQENR
jgi:hypothetical protein